MKKTVLLLGVALLVLTGCGSKKSNSGTASSKDKIDTTLPIIANAEKNTVMTRTLVFPKNEDGSQQKQIVTYKGDQFLGLTLDGIDEAQNLLNKSLEEDANYQQVKDLPGFSTSLQILNENELKRLTTLDFQTLDVEKAANTEYLKGLKLKELLKIKPAQYIDNQIVNGASEEK